MKVNLKDYYFSRDGSYGYHFVVINTDKWTHEDWEKVEGCSDSERMDSAYKIEARKRRLNKAGRA